jgi:hypothetical protein
MRLAFGATFFLIIWESYMTLMKSLTKAAFAAVLFSASVAHAAVLQFNLTGDYTAQWQMDADRVPEEYFTELGAVFWDNAGTFPGSTGTLVDLAFFNGGFGGGMSIYDLASGDYLLVADGPQIYAGTEINPHFAPGTFALTEYEGIGNYLLTVTEVAEAAVPEPATGALFVGGLALLYGARRRRQR